MGSVAAGTRLDPRAILEERNRKKKAAMIQYLAQECRVTVLDVLHDAGGGVYSTCPRVQNGNSGLTNGTDRGKSCARNPACP
jgi:hypothetical protein